METQTLLNLSKDAFKDEAKLAELKNKIDWNAVQAKMDDENNKYFNVGLFGLKFGDEFCGFLKRAETKELIESTVDVVGNDISLYVPALFHTDSDLAGDVRRSLQKIKTDVADKNSLLRLFMRAEQRISQDKKSGAVELMTWQDPSYNNHYDKLVDKLFKDKEMEAEAGVWALIAVFRLIATQFYLEKGIRKCSLPSCPKFDENKNFSKCAKCASVYCGREDQVKHWKSGHKQQCKELTKATDVATNTETCSNNANEQSPAKTAAEE